MIYQITLLAIGRITFDAIRLMHAPSPNSFCVSEVGVVPLSVWTHYYVFYAFGARRSKTVATSVSYRLARVEMSGLSRSGYEMSPVNAE